MAEIKWIKITTTMFDDEKIKLIDAMPERDTIFNIWIKLLVQAGKTNANGYIFLTENIPYTEEMLSTLFNRPLQSVRLALQTLKNFGMIDMSENNLIKISNWEKHQNIEGMEKVREQNRLRKQKQRSKMKELQAPAKEEVTGAKEDSHITSRDSHAIEREEERDKDIDKEREKEREKEKEENIISVSPKDNLIEVCKFYESAGFGTINLITQQKLEVLIEMYSKEWVKDAIETSVLRGKYRLTYVEGILQNWKAEGRDKKKNRGEKSESNSTDNGQQLRSEGIGL